MPGRCFIQYRFVWCFDGATWINELNYMVIRTVMIVVRFPHTAVQQVLLRKVEKTQWERILKSVFTTKLCKEMSCDDYCAHRFMRCTFFPYFHWQTLQASGRTSIMSSIGHCWLEPGMNSPKASAHLEEEKHKWILTNMTLVPPSGNIKKETGTSTTCQYRHNLEDGMETKRLQIKALTAGSIQKHELTWLITWTQSPESVTRLTPPFNWQSYSNKCST